MAHFFAYPKTQEAKERGYGSSVDFGLLLPSAAGTDGADGRSLPGGHRRRGRSVNGRPGGAGDGKCPAEGKLPYHMPADMATIEKHCEDVFDDYVPYRDSEGNLWAYGFGLKTDR